MSTHTIACSKFPTIEDMISQFAIYMPHLNGRPHNRVPKRSYSLWSVEHRDHPAVMENQVEAQTFRAPLRPTTIPVNGMCLCIHFIICFVNL
jgi:hypothetical protein